MMLKYMKKNGKLWREVREENYQMARVIFENPSAEDILKEVINNDTQKKYTR